MTSSLLPCVLLLVAVSSSIVGKREANKCKQHPQDRANNGKATFPDPNVKPLPHAKQGKYTESSSLLLFAVKTRSLGGQDHRCKTDTLGSTATAKELRSDDKAMSEICFSA
jgi:hypothetical protein